MVVLGKAKVVTFEELEKARTDRAAEEQATVGKRRRGRKIKKPENATKYEGKRCRKDDSAASKTGKCGHW
jgi:hypothetical protein